MKVLVTGSNGQLGREIQDASKKFDHLKFVFKNSSELDISENKQLEEVFKQYHFDYCINCAAYTNVDQAELHPFKAEKINATAVGHLAQLCNQYQVTLLHISTDYVFDGNSQVPYKEQDKTAPINAYGLSKFNGEQELIQNLRNYFLIRTSWVYSKYGHNFVKTIIKLSKTKHEIKVVNDQFGSPTHAKDLAEFLLTIISSKNKQYGVYHYSNEGVTNWFEFSKAINDFFNTPMHISPVPSTEYKTIAKRPHYSLLNHTKAQETFKVNIPKWQDSLQNCLSSLDYHE